MPRDMSYRKPVPVYIPSPPSSPLTEQEEESNSDEHASQEIPPLPREWREAIERALSLSVLIPPSNYGSDESDVLNQHASININTFNVVKQPTLVRRESTSSAAFLSQEEKRQRQRQIHRIYRPPTPPLRAHQPKRRKIGLDDEWVDSCSTLPERIGSTAMRLQSSRSTGQTLVATSSTAAFAGRKRQVAAMTGWTSTMKRVCGQLATKLEKRMRWLRC